MAVALSQALFPQMISPPVSYGFKEAVDEACKYIGQTSPNPPVGCVLLDRNYKIIAKGAHQFLGGPHAEQAAIAQAEKTGVLAQAYIAIVTLEPCNHVGRTPSCVQTILKTPIKKVFIGCSDPNPLVKGGGAKALLEAGLDVQWLAPNSGPSSDFGRCASLLATFKHTKTQARPWITVKQALREEDGQLTMMPPEAKKTFTSQKSLTLVHELRKMTDGVISGGGTIRADLPYFTIRYCDNPTPRKRLLILFTQSRKLPPEWLEGRKEDFDVMFCHELGEFLDILKGCSALWLMVEAGPSLLQFFKDNALWDDWLTITQTTDGREAWHFASRHVFSPLMMMRQSSQFAKEQVCFPEL